jgi:hypothetical protein
MSHMKLLRRSLDNNPYSHEILYCYERFSFQTTRHLRHQQSLFFNASRNVVHFLYQRFLSLS